MAPIKIRPFKNPPPEIAKLVKKFRGNRSAAARAIGYSYVGPLSDFGHRKKELTDEVRAKIAAVLRGETLPDAVSGPRKGNGNRAAMPAMAMVISPGTAFERLHDMAAVMGGVWKFKRRVGKEWVGLIVMKIADLEDFLELAKKRGAETITV